MWNDFATGPLSAYAAVNEAQMRGLDIEPVELLSLGPDPAPSRPGKPLRIGVGFVLAMALMTGKDQTGT